MKDSRFGSFLAITALLIPVLLAFSAAPAQAGKPRIAIIDFDSEQRYFYHDWWNRKDDIEYEVNALFVNELVNSGKFTVIERQRLEEILKEQNLTLSGNVDPSTAVKAGKLLGVELILTGRITKFGFREVGGEGAFGLAFKAKKKTLEGGLSVRLINTTTAEILFADEATGEDSHFNVKVATFGGGVDYDETMIDKVFRPAVEELSTKIISKADNFEGTGVGGVRSLQGKISKVSGGVIYLNIGSSSGVKVGDTFTVFGLGEEIIDPDTGESLGAEETQVGTIKVTEVKEKYAKATAVSGSGFAKGNMIRK